MAVILTEEITSETLLETIVAQAKGRPSKTKKVEDDEDLDDEDVAPKKSSKKASEDDDDDEDDDIDGVEEDDDEWDPDFEEFDLPKSRKGKAASKAEEEEDFKVEDTEDFKDLDLFNDSESFDDEDDDF
jgi:DNA-directed RNA polymerase subunit delta